MMTSKTVLLAAGAIGFASLAHGQQSGWLPNQINSTMCYWDSMRAATLRDTVYLDGGYLWWVPGMGDGSNKPPVQDGNLLGLMYTLNFSRPWDSNSNVSQILDTLSKVSSGSAANNVAPNYFDGALLANDDEFYLYGGLLTPTDSFSYPGASDVLSYEKYQYGVNKPSFRSGFLNAQASNGITRYVTFGGAANVPSENKAFYFGGQRAASWGPILYPSGNTSANPTNVSNTLITLDMSIQGSESWSNVTLPSNVSSRANPELVWVPVGSQGILVALGGVTYPEYDNPAAVSRNSPQSKKDSPSFMANIDVYDIAGGKWYQQPTTGGPGQLTKGCTVMAAAKDNSSFNIYYYGGFDGLDASETFNDDVWVLSLPSFTWTKVATGTSLHGRAGHKCVKAYPDQMISIGGYASLPGVTPRCLTGGLLQNFNLTSATWLDSYDPSKWSDYGVPSAVVSKIGGSPAGGATVTTPSPSGWSNAALGSVFATAYPATKLTTYYPYPSVALTNTTNPNLPANSSTSGGGGGGGGGTPSWVAPVLGVVLGLVFITALVVGVLLWRRRRLLRKNGGMSEPSSDENGHRILSWIRGQASEKAPTVTTEDTPVNADEYDQRPPVPVQRQPEMVQATPPQEMPNTPLVELMDTSPRAELHDTGLSHMDIINRHTHLGAKTPRFQGSYFNSASSQDGASSVSSPSQVTSSGAVPRSIATTNSMRPDSPSLGAPRPAGASELAGSAAGPSNPRITSEVSNLSEREASHLRNLSDGQMSVSTAHSGGVEQAPPTTLQLAALQSPLSPEPHTAGVDSIPVSPPTAEERDAPDYISARPPGHQSLNAGALLGTPEGQPSPTLGGGSPLKKSAFRENQDDMEDGGK